MPYLFLNTGYPSGLAADETVSVFVFSARGGRWISAVLTPPGAPTPGTSVSLNHASAIYQALSTDVLIRVDVSGGALAGAIDIGTNAPVLQKITVVDYTWSVAGAGMIFIPVSGGSHNIQDPNTGAVGAGPVMIKQTGAPVSWIYDPAVPAMVLA
jgi:hypothetical protein